MTWKEGLADEEVAVPREAIAFALKQTELGTKVEEVFRQMDDG
jgi:hypothetical protein